MKRQVKVWHLVILALLLSACFIVNEGNNNKRHEETRHAQDSINARYQYVIDYHFQYCKFDTNEKYKPFGN